MSFGVLFFKFCKVYLHIMKEIDLKPIRSREDYGKFLDWIDEQFDNGIEPNTPEGDQLEIALLLVKDYEDKHFRIPYPDPIEAIKAKMEDNGLKNKDLVDWVGSKSYVSALLNRKKPLTLRLAKAFHEKLGIPAEVLLS